MSEDAIHVATTFGYVILALGALIVISAFIALVAHTLRRNPISFESPRPERKSLPIVEQKCGNCEHWDYEGGQATMARFPAFQGATEALSPAEMAHGIVVNDDGVRMGSKCQDPKVKALMWRDFGACVHHDVMELRAKSDSCTNFHPKQV